MAKKIRFESKYHNYVKYVKLEDGTEVKVQFQNGIYETDRKEIIEALKKDRSVREIK